MKKEKREEFGDYGSISLIELNQFAVCFVLYEPMHIIVGRIVPHSIAAQLHRVRVLSELEMAVGMSVHVTSATNVATNQANPQVLV